MLWASYVSFFALGVALVVVEAVIVVLARGLRVVAFAVVAFAGMAGSSYRCPAQAAPTRDLPGACAGPSHEPAHSINRR
jgi:hypothetical protein